MSLKYYDVSPYYDDYDQTKNYQRILFRPGYSVQARELTQLQTALQAQIDRFGRHIFKDGSPAVGGLASLDVKFAYVKLESTFTYSATPFNSDNYYEELIGTTITGQTSGITAIVLDATAATVDDPLTIFVKYTATGDDNATHLFAAEEYLLSDADVVRRVKVKPAADYPVGYGTRVSVNEGVFFVSGNFVYTPADSIILDKYTTLVSSRVVYVVAENIVTSATDATLSDNALGSPNEAAPGAHRYQITLTLAKQPFAFADRSENNIVQLIVIENGKVKATARTSYSELGDILAQRTYEESGNYTVRPFQVNIKELRNDTTNGGLYTTAQLRDLYPTTLTNNTLANTYGDARLAIGLEPSVAYVNGYRIQLESTTYVEVEKARDEGYFNASSTLLSLGNYILVDTVTSVPDVNTFTPVLLKISSTQRGTARARSFEYVSGTVGSSAALYKLYLFDIQMDTGYALADIDNVSQTGVGGAAAFLATINGTDAVLYDSNYNSLLFRLPVNTVQSLRSSVGDIDTLYTVKKKYDNRVTSGSGVVTLTAASDEIFESTSNQDWIACTDDGTVVAPNSIVIGGGGSTATLTFSGNVSTAMYIIAPTRRNLREKIKNLEVDHNVALSSPSPSAPISLAITDLFQVKAIYDSRDGGAADDNDLDVTDRYLVDNGQRENFYDVATIQLKPGAVAPTGNLLVVLDYFSHQPGDYFSVDSYSDVDYGDIPSFQSAKGLIQLRDALDFRPTVTIAGSAFTGTGSSLTSMPKPNSILTADIQYYLPRIDKIYVNKNGQFGVVKGISSAHPIAPEDPKDAMVLYVLQMGAYTFSAADTIPKMIDNKRYTMRDIGKIDKRVTNLEYYTSLSLLEKDTAGTQIFDGAAVRYKNGFVVDGFYGHNVGAVTNPDYSVSTDKNAGKLRPMFYEDNTRLVWNSAASSNVRKTGSLLTLDYYTSAYITQPYASYAEYVNPYMVFNWTGDLAISPNTDEWKETLRAPDVVIDQSGIYDSLIQMVDASGAIGTVWNEWQTNWTGSSVATQSETTVTQSDPFVTITDTATTLTTTTTGTSSRTGIRTSVVPDTVLTTLGDKVVEVNFVPFIRSRKIYFKATRLKPNTKVYAFFDGVDMSNFVREEGSFVDYSSSTNASNYLNASVHPDGISELITNTDGEVIGSFVIPNTEVLKFKTGQRSFRLTNSATNDLKYVDTSAEAVYFAQGLLNTVENQVVSTRVPHINRTQVSDQKVVVDIGRPRTTTTTVVVNDTPVVPPPEPIETVPPFDLPPWTTPDSEGNNPWVTNWSRAMYTDPLAQSFIIDTEGGVFVTSLDIYFAQKDATAPVTVQIRTMVNGAPTQTVVPFSQVTKAADDITISSIGNVATSFVFDSPVYLMQGAEYCFVVMANSDKHKIWVSELGSYDVTNTAYRITKQPYDGVMFKSANASTWTPEQTKDIKFTLVRAAFTDQTGIAVFNNPALPVRNLGNDALSTTTSSREVRVFHKNHGHFAGVSQVTLAGIIANSGGNMNGIPIGQLNTTHTVDSATIDSYTIITATTAATSTGRAGGTLITATENKTYNVLHPIVQQSVIPATAAQWSIKSTSGTSLAGSETPHIVSTSYTDIKVNDNTSFSRPQTIVSAPNVGSLSTGTQSLTLRSQMVRAGSADWLTPVIDLDRMSVITIANRIDNPIGSATSGYNEVYNFLPETSSTGGSTLSKYITRKIELNDAASALNVFVLANCPSSASIKLYYKILASGTDTNFDTIAWVEAAPDAPVPTSDNPNEYSEVQYSITEGELGHQFTAFAIKISFTSQNSSAVPTCRDFRAIAIT